MLPRWGFGFLNLRLSYDSLGLEGVAHTNHITSTSGAGDTSTSNSSQAFLLEHVSTQSGALAQCVVHAQGQLGISVSSFDLIFAVASQNGVRTHGHAAADGSDVVGLRTICFLADCVDQVQLGNAEIVAAGNCGGFGSVVSDGTQRVVATFRTIRRPVSGGVTRTLGAQNLQSQGAVGIVQAQDLALVGAANQLTCVGCRSCGLCTSCGRQGGLIVSAETSDAGGGIADTVLDGQSANQTSARCTDGAGSTSDSGCTASATPRIEGAVAQFSHLAEANSTETTAQVSIGFMEQRIAVACGAAITSGSVETDLTRETALEATAQVFCSHDIDGVCTTTQRCNLSGIASGTSVHHANADGTRNGSGGLSESSGGSQGSQSNNERLCTESSAKLQQRFRNISTSLRVQFVWSATYNKLNAAHPFFLNGHCGIDLEINGSEHPHEISNASNRNCPCAHTTLRLTHEFLCNYGKQ